MNRFENEISLRDIFRVLFRHKGKVMGWGITAMLATVFVTLWSHEKFHSECKLLIRLGRENVLLDPTAAGGAGPVTRIPQNLEGEVNSIVEILRSRGLHERLVDDLGPAAILDEAEQVAATGLATAAGESSTPGSAPTNEASLPSSPTSSVRRAITPQISDRERALAQIEKDLVIESVKRSDVITLEYEASSPELAQKILQKLVDLYLDHHLHLHRTPGARQFFAEQAEETRSRLQKTADELRDLKNLTGIASIEEQRRILMNRLGELRIGSLTSQSELAASEVQVEFLTKRLATLPEQVEVGRVNGFSGPGASLSQQIQSLQSKEKTLLAESGADDAKVKETQQLLARVKEAAGAVGPNSVQINTGVNRVFEEARLALFNQQTLIASFRAKAELLDEQYTASQAELQKLNDHEVRITQLERELQLQDLGYRKYADNLEQARIDEALQMERISNIRLAELPTLEEQPVSPRPVRNLAIGILIAVLGGIVLAFVAERTDHSIKTSRELEQRLDIPALVSIPRMRASAARMNGGNGDG